MSPVESAAPFAAPDDDAVLRVASLEPILMKDTDRDLEFDLQALASALRADRGFADEMYCALCNTDWRHVDGTEWHGSWRYSAGLVATLRGRGEDYIDFYCTRACEEGTISERVASVMAELGWSGQGHGSKALYSPDPSNGEQTVWVSGGWVDIEDARRERRERRELFTGDPADDSLTS